jgi:hypothetical protein
MIKIIESWNKLSDNKKKKYHPIHHSPQTPRGSGLRPEGANGQHLAYPLPGSGQTTHCPIQGHSVQNNHFNSLLADPIKCNSETKFPLLEGEKARPGSNQSQKNRRPSDESVFNKNDYCIRSIQIN